METLQDMVSSDTLEPDLANQVLLQFDKSIVEALQFQVKRQVTIQGPTRCLRTYRYCNHVWTFMVRDALVKIKDEVFKENVGLVKIVACDSDLLKQ